MFLDIPRIQFNGSIGHTKELNNEIEELKFLKSNQESQECDFGDSVTASVKFLEVSLYV